MEITNELLMKVLWYLRRWGLAAHLLMESYILMPYTEITNAEVSYLYIRTRE